MQAILYSCLLSEYVLPAFRYVTVTSAKLQKSVSWVIYVLVIYLLCLSDSLSAQHVGIKTNLLSDLSTTPNLGMEIGLTPHWSLESSGGYNAWEFSGDRKFKHAFGLVEARYWLCQRFNGHFFGVHMLGGIFNVGGWDVSFVHELKTSRYEGWTAGVGLAYGYQWMIGRRWNLEASFGIGYVQARYDHYQCQHCGDLIESKVRKGFVTPTKAAVSIIYLIK